jgi:peptidyl-prolyl cis-trans isomerase D
MLDLMRKHAESWLIKAILYLLVAVFGLWGVSYSIFARIKPVASVDGHQILSKDIDQRAELIRREYQNLYGANAAAAMAHLNVREQALEQLIDQQLELDEAHNLGLKVSDAELERAIASQSDFQVDGHFDFQTYQAVLRSNGMHPADYEADTRSRLLQELMFRMATAGVRMSETEARQEFDQLNLKLSLSYVEFPFLSFTASIVPSDKQIAEFYKQHREDFREPERISFDFIRYDPDKMAIKFAPSDREIENYYNRNRESQFTRPEQVHARHILIAVPSDATAQQKAAAKATAEDILVKVKAGADFAKLAKQYSGDPGTKNNGGDLGNLSPGETVKPFDEAVFKLRSGEMAVVETKYGYHVVKVDEHKPAHLDTLAEARPQIIEALRHRAGADAARQAVDQDLSAALTGSHIADLAEKRGLLLARTPLLAVNERTTGIEDPRVMQEAFKLKPGDIRVITGRDVSFLVKLNARSPSYIPKLADIQDKVREALVRQMAEAQAHDRAGAFIKQLKEPADLAKAAAAAKLAVRSTGEFSRSDNSVPTLGDFPDAVQAAAILPSIPGIVDRPLTLQGNAYVVEVTSRAAPSEDQWKQAKDDFMARMLRQRQMQAWAGFLQAMRERAQIVVHPELIGQAPESSM